MRKLPKGAHLERWSAEAEAAAKNSRPVGAKGKFGSGLYRVYKDGPIAAPYWLVKEVR